MESTLNTKCFKELQQLFHNSLGPSFWDSHEESPKLRQCVHTVNTTQTFFEELEPSILFHTKQEHAAFTDRRFPGVRRCLTAMGPYLGQPPEEVTGRISRELQSGNMFWFECFTEFMHWVLLAFPSRLSDEILPILGLDLSVIKMKM